MSASPPAHATTVTAQINHQRAIRGIPALQPIGILRSSSYGLARRMIRRDRFMHDIGAPVARRFRRFGENVAITFRRGGPRTVVAMWMRSPAHRRIILSPAWRYVGSGFAAGRFGGRFARTWVARFAG